MAERLDVHMVRGEDFFLTFYDRDKDTKFPVDTTGFSGALKVRASDDSSTVILNLSSEITFGGTNGAVYLIIPAADTLALAVGRHEYDLKVTDADSLIVFMVQGFWEVSENKEEIHRIVVDIGEDYALNINLVDGNTGGSVDTSEYISGRFILKNDLEDADVDAIYDETSPVTFAASQVLVDIPNAETATWAAGDYEYKITATRNSGVIEVIDTGFCKVNPVVTY